MLKTLDAEDRFKQQQQQLVGTIDGVRSSFRGGLETFVDDLERGKSAGSAFRDVMSGLGHTLQNAGLDMLTQGLLGGSGTPGGGAAGGLISSLIGGLGKGFEGWMPKFAGGGSAYGAGTGTSDSILARVSHGEYIVNAHAAGTYRNVLDRINGSGLPGFALGGLVGMAPSGPGGGITVALVEED